MQSQPGSHLLLTQLGVAGGCGRDLRLCKMEICGEEGSGAWGISLHKEDSGTQRSGQ